MAAIVQSKKTGKRYVVLGAGFSLFKTTHTSPIFGGWFPNKDQGNEQLLAVCDSQGKPGFIQIADAEVVSVDGVSLAELLSKTPA